MPTSLLLRAWLCALLLFVCVASPALGGSSDTDAELDVDTVSEEQATLGLDQEILNSAAREIQAQLDLETDLNQNQGDGQDALHPLSAEARSLDITSTSGPTTDAFAFLSEAEEPVSQLQGVDVEQHLDTIATELDSLFKTDAELAAEAEEKADQAARAEKRQRRAARWHKTTAVRHTKANKHEHMQAASKKSAPVAAHAAPAPSSRQQKLISRLDAYRSARGHEDVSTLEATAHARSTVNNGYSMPSAYAPGVVGGVVPVAAAVPNPFAWLQPQAPVVQQAAATVAPSASIAGVGMLLQVLKQAQEQQDASNMLSRLGALLNAASRPQVAQPQMIPQAVASPFNYGQSFVATPNGYVNPNLLPQTFGGPRLLPGAIPGMSPSYPSFIPGEQAPVAHESEQTNPFEEHQP